MDNVHCTGAESNLTSCRHSTNHDCVHSKDAGVRCTRNSNSKFKAIFIVHTVHTCSHCIAMIMIYFYHH